MNLLLSEFSHLSHSRIRQELEETRRQSDEGEVSGGLSHGAGKGIEDEKSGEGFIQSDGNTPCNIPWALLRQAPLLPP